MLLQSVLPTLFGFFPSNDVIDILSKFLATIYIPSIMNIFYRISSVFYSFWRHLIKNLEV